MPSITVSSTRLFYQEQGQGTPLVMLHGLGGSSNDWLFSCQYLQKDYRCILLDLPGFGQSDNTPNYSIHDMAILTVAALQQLGIDECNLVGFSLGGAVALDICAHKDKHCLTINKLVIINSQPSYQLNHYKLKIEYYFRVALMKMCGLSALSHMIAKRLFPLEKDHALRQYVENGLKENTTNAYLSAMKALVSWSIKDKLHNITQVTMIIASDNDYPSLDSKGYVAQLPNASLTMIPSCGHAIPIEKPEVLATTLHTFLER